MRGGEKGLDVVREKPVVPGELASVQNRACGGGRVLVLLVKVNDSFLAVPCGAGRAWAGIGARDMKSGRWRVGGQMGMLVRGQRTEGCWISHAADA